MELEFSPQNFESYWNTKFHEKLVQWAPSCFMRADVTKLTVDFRDSANAHKSGEHIYSV